MPTKLVVIVVVVVVSIAIEATSPPSPSESPSIPFIAVITAVPRATISAASIYARIDIAASYNSLRITGSNDGLLLRIIRGGSVGVRVGISLRVGVITRGIVLLRIGHLGSVRA